MAKKFMFVCVGLLALTAAFLLGAQFGRAEYVDHSTTGVVAGGGGNVLLDNGEVWYYDDSEFEWTHNPADNLPVPLSTIKFWAGRYYVDTANQMWRHDPDGSWFNCGTPPMGGIATQPSSWGSIKAQFKN